MAVPELDALAVGRWCADHTPAQFRDQRRVECEVSDRHVTLFESQPATAGVPGGEWVRTPFARLRFTMTTGLWTLYSYDRGRFREYPFRAPTPLVEDLLNYIDSTGDPIFWG